MSEMQADLGARAPRSLEPLEVDAVREANAKLRERVRELVEERGAIHARLDDALAKLETLTGNASAVRQ